MTPSSAGGSVGTTFAAPRQFGIWPDASGD